ncbi:hypothetical protein Droror1_Dr00025086 [Drosera rotundifolia]
MLSPLPPPLHLSSLRVAVIGGAGAAGLSASRELRREGHKVVAYEHGERVGGTWVYTDEVESDPVGVEPRRNVVHSSIYRSLRTNLPREVMGFRDYPFVASGRPGRDARRFPGHEEVLRYLEDFARDFKLYELVRFQSEVLLVRLDEDGMWTVRSRTNAADGETVMDEKYDAVVVCNGHYTEPRLAEIPGIKEWPGSEIHSHNYRVPEPYRDQIVVIIGSSASAVDISRDIASVANEVHIAARSTQESSHGILPGHGNMWLHPMISSTRRDGTVVFRDGTSVKADVIMYCTGYKYHFPFLKANVVVTVDDNRVGPLYEHVFPPVLAPWLSFVGLPWKVIPFPLIELQSKWIAGALSGRIALPSQESMIKSVEALYSTLEAARVPKRYTHNLGGCQFEYYDRLAAECTCAPSEEWRKVMYSSTSMNRKVRPDAYRDEWEDDHMVLKAQEDFAKYLS